MIEEYAPLLVFGVLLLATLGIHFGGYLLRPKTVGSKALLVLGLVVVFCMAGQFYYVQQNAARARPRTITDVSAPRSLKD